MDASFFGNIVFCANERDYRLVMGRVAKSRVRVGFWIFFRVKKIGSILSALVFYIKK